MPQGNMGVPQGAGAHCTVPRHAGVMHGTAMDTELVQFCQGYFCNLT